MANIELILEKPCEGYWDYKEHEWYPCTTKGNCPTCKGHETVPTELGQQILNLVRKFS